MDLQLHQIVKAFGAHRVLDGVEGDFQEIRTLALIGPSGSGKSTLLRLIAGLLVPDSGTIVLDGETIPATEPELRRYRRSIGVVFQAFNLFPHLSALENLTLPLEKVHGQTPEEAMETALSVLRRFRLEKEAHKRPAELSGGQKQRVAIARAIAIKPKLLLFDEPTSALDPEMTAEVLEVIEELRFQGSDFVLVTHEMGFARKVADQVAFLADGKIVEAGPAEAVFEAPQSPVCSAFLAKVLRY